MTTFDILESSDESSRPIELYEITKGTTTWRFTSAEDDITPASDTFTAEAIQRGKIQQGSDQENRNVTITLPSNNSFASQYIEVVPGEKASVSIFRYQRDEVPAFNTQVLLFKGQVQSVQFPNDGHTASIALRSIESALNRNIPRFTFMSMCNHILYSADCGATASSFDHTGNVSSISGNTVTVSGLNASGLDFVGGYCRPTGVEDFRMILAQSGDVLTLLLPFASDPTGMNLQAFAGCDHVLTGDCALVFDRVADFGGFHFVSEDNIFQTGLTV
jgi:hypothetical protein